MLTLAQKFNVDYPGPEIPDGALAVVRLVMFPDGSIAIHSEELSGTQDDARIAQALLAGLEMIGHAPPSMVDADVVAEA